jgi:D-3-phosphoglycerate dehydrogenase
MNKSDIVCVTSRSFSNNEILKNELLSRYKNVVFNTTGKSLHGDNLKSFLSKATKAIIALENIDNELLDCLPNLDVISKYGVGLDSLDMSSLKEHNIKLGWTPGVNKRSVAELVIGFSMLLTHKIPRAIEMVNQGVWKQVVGNLIQEKTIGIIGYGNIGKEVAKLFKPFGCHILVNDILDLQDVCDTTKVEQVSLETLLQESDIVTLHVPYNKSTSLFLDKQKLSLLKKNASIINLSRGGMIDEDCLDDYVRSGRIEGAYLDVLQDEPIISSKLASNPRIVLTPHIGGSAEEAILAMGRAAIDGLDNYKLVE